MRRRLYLVRPAAQAQPRPDPRSAKVIVLRVRRPLREQRRAPQPDRPDAA